MTEEMIEAVIVDLVVISVGITEGAVRTVVLPEVVRLRNVS